MKRVGLFFGILLTVLSLNGCILSSSPSSKEVITLSTVDSLEFKVTTQGVGVTEWYLNGVKAGSGNSYIFNTLMKVGRYTLKAVNQNSVVWTIDVYYIDYIYFEDADGDGYGNPERDIIYGSEQPLGYVANADDCDDNNADVHPGAEEIPGDGIDNDCADGDLNPCIDPIVSASDIESGLTNIHVTWNPVCGATHYNLYMAIDQDSPYEMIASNLTDTSYVFVEDWKTDVTDVVGEMPKLPPKATPSEMRLFENQLVAYREAVLPLMHSFKNVKYFRFQACDEMACLPLSEPDAGQAEFVHTEAFSDISEMLTIMAGYPLLMYYTVSMDPAVETWCGNSGNTWCTPSVSGAFGGEFVGYVDSELVVHAEYHDYTEGYLPSRIFTFAGEIGGAQSAVLALQGVVNVKGNLTVTGAVDAQMHLWMSMGGTSDKPSQGTIDVTYKGATCQFPLPL